MRKANGLGLTAAFMIWWVSLVAYPALHRPVEGRASRPEGQSSIEPGLFFPLLGAWTLPESPMLRFPPCEDRLDRP